MTYSPGVVNTISIGGLTLPRTNLISLYGRFNASNNAFSFRQSSNQTSGATVSAGYTPSGSNKFRLLILKVRIISTNTSDGANLHYTDNDLGISSGTSSTNPVYCMGAAPSSAGYLVEYEAKGEQVIVTDFLVPNGKYVGMKGGSSTGGLLAVAYGYEEA